MTWMPLGELLEVRTLVCDSSSTILTCLKILTPAILGAFLRRENLKASLSSGLCRNKSALGYSKRIFFKMEGPVSSNFLAAPTRQIAILDPLTIFFSSQTLPAMEEEEEEEGREIRLVEENCQETMMKSTKDKGIIINNLHLQSKPLAHLTTNLPVGDDGFAGRISLPLRLFCRQGFFASPVTIMATGSNMQQHNHT